MFEML